MSSRQLNKSYRDFNVGLARLGFASYQDYLASDHWQSFKDRRKSAGIQNVCSVCGGTAGLSLHHVTYERLGAEEFDDVVPLCKGHHNAIHEALASRRLPLAKTTDVIAELVAKRESKPAKRRKKKRKPKRKLCREEIEARELAKSQARCRAIFERMELHARLVGQLDARKTPTDVRAYVLKQAGQSEAWRIQWWLDAVIYNPPGVLTTMSVARDKTPFRR